MMDRRCKNCAWWQTDDPYDHYSELIPTFDPDTYEPLSEEQVRERFAYAVRYCKHPRLVFYERPDQSGAAVIDGSKYYAALLTGEDFGCVQFEQRAETA